MASPMLEGRSLNPREKAHFSLQISDRIAQNDSSLPQFSSVKYNHKPAQTTSSRNTTLTSTSADRYALKIQDHNGGKQGDLFTFTGQRTVPKKSSYVLLFDPASQKATLEPLSSTYTFNVATKNKADISSTHPKIYPKKSVKDDGPQQQHAAEKDDLFDEGATGNGGHETDEPDPDNPYDFRHFLNKDKKGDESEYGIASSPDDRTGTGSAMNTPLMAARRSAAATPTSKPAPSSQPAARKRRTPEPSAFVSKKAAPKKTQPTPAVRLEKRATQPKTETKKAAAPPSAKIKSAEVIHSSDESDADAEGEPASPAGHRSPEPAPHTYDDDEDEDMEDVDIGGGGGGGGLVIEDPDARPSQPRNNALSKLGLGQSIGLGGRSLSNLRSPSNGPISLASAANSVEGSPNPDRHFTPPKSRPTRDEDVIDFGDIGGSRPNDSEEEEEGGDVEEEQDDGDVEPMDIGPPAQQQSTARRVSVDEAAMDEDADGEGEEEDPLYKEMMEGLAGGDSSEESEEE